MSEAPRTYDVENFKKFFEREFTWLNGFLRNVRRFPDSPALFDPSSDKRWTYAELNADANLLANAILAAGARKNDVIAFALFNSPEFVFCYLACHKIGAIACPINFRLSSGEIALQLEDSRPRVFVYGEKFAEIARDATRRSSFKPPALVVVDGGAVAGEIEFYDFVKNASNTNPPLPENADIYDETTRLYTSGTTNRAKAVPINSLNEVLSSHDVIMHLPLTPKDKTMNMTPWFHRGGLHSAGIAPTLYVGGEVIILREFNPRRCLEVAAKTGVTYLVGVPSILALLARAQEFARVDLSALRGVVTMGSPFAKADLERYKKLFTPNIFNGYGTTETFWNTFLRPFDPPEVAGSAGRSCVDDDVRVARLPEDGSRANPENLAAKDAAEVGEILIRSPAKSAGCYVNNPKMTAEKFHDGFHYTGDLGVWDKNGYVAVVGRKDDMIVSAGENIYPTQIESILKEHPDIEDAAVVGVPDKRHGQSVAAYVTPKNKDLTVAQIKSWCAERPMLSGFKRPKYVYLVQDLPRNAAGKLLHYKVREMAARDALAEANDER